MGRKSRTQQLAESIAGQHLALEVAAHLARTQLVPDPLAFRDAQHIGEMLDVVARALIRVAPTYVCDATAGAARQLLEDELGGATVRCGATLLVLKDGRGLSRVSIKRADLRQAIAILKKAGIQELGRGAKPAQPSRTEPRDCAAQLRAALGEVEELLRPPLVPAQVDRANKLMVSIARNAPHGRIADLAMRLMSALHEARDDESPEGSQIGLQLARLRAAVEEAR